MLAELWYNNDVVGILKIDIISILKEFTVLISFERQALIHVTKFVDLSIKN